MATTTTLESMIPRIVTWLRAQGEAHHALADAMEEAVLGQPAPTPARTSLLVPAYFRDADPPAPSQWERLYAAAAKVDITVIANPASGPSTSKTWAGIMARIFSTPRMKAIGYVSTDYARFTTKLAAAITADIAEWYRLYPGVVGIFFDEQAKGPEHVGKYKVWFDDVHARGGRVWSNPGLACDPGYRSAAGADTLVLWEKNAASGVPTLPPWAKDAPDEACAGLVSICDEATMASYLPKMEMEGYRQVFFTSEPRWSGGLGSGFDRLVALVSS